MNNHHKISWLSGGLKNTLSELFKYSKDEKQIVVIKGLVNTPEAATYHQTELNKNKTTVVEVSSNGNKKLCSMKLVGELKCTLSQSEFPELMLMTLSGPFEFDETEWDNLELK